MARSGRHSKSLHTAPNAHAILTDKSNTHALATSLGGDVVNQFDFSPKSGVLSWNSPSTAKVGTKAGPRHFRFGKDEKFVYVLNELDGTVYVFNYQANGGTLGMVVQTLSAMPPGVQAKPWAADMQITPDGKFLYVSERTTSTISGYRIDASGMLIPNGTIATEQQPRGFAIDPSSRFLLVAGEKSDSISVYAIDEASGHLGLHPKTKEPGTPSQRLWVGKSPNWIEIVELP